MYLAPPPVASSLQSGITPATTSGPGTTGQSNNFLAVITPDVQPTTLSSVVSGGLSMLLFAWGWSHVGTLQARAKMPSKTPADKKAYNTSRWQGIAAASLLGTAMWFSPDQYKRWVLVGGLPATAWFLPGLFRGILLGFWPASKEKMKKQQQRRTKQRRRQMQRRRPQARDRRAGPYPEMRFQEEIDVEPMRNRSRPSPQALRRGRGRRRSPNA